MFKAANVGAIDRIIRIVVGIALIVLPFTAAVPALADGYARYAALIVGAILVLTALVRFCPLYRLIGASTCKVG